MNLRPRVWKWKRKTGYSRSSNLRVEFKGRGLREPKGLAETFRSFTTNYEGGFRKSVVNKESAIDCLRKLKLINYST